MKRTDIVSVNEAKEVLEFLGVDKSQYENVEDFETLLEMVCEREGELIHKIGVKDALTFKEIFNTFRTMEERCAELKKLCEYTETYY